MTWIGAVLVATLFFWATALFSVRVLYRPLDVLLLWLIYLLFSTWLVLTARWALSKHPALGWAAFFALSTIAWWHLREQTRRPESLAALVSLATLTSVVLILLAVRLAASHRRYRIVGPLIAGISFFALTAACFSFLPSHRWHLLRHNTLLGTPLYYLLAEPVTALERDLFARAGKPPAELTVPSSQLSQPSRAMPPGQQTFRPPNLVVVLVDTLRADALAPWGGDATLMPNTHKWLESADRFTDVVANSSWTRPSVASFLTGLLPEEHGARNVADPIAAGIPTFAERLLERGYRTTALVTNVGAAGAGAGFARGFELFHEFKDEPYARADKVNRVLDAWLEDRETEDDRPLLLYLHYLDPHDPYLSGDAPKHETAPDYWRAYRRELQFFDQHFGELLDLLENHLDGPTLLLLISDHGEEFFEHGLFGHGHSLYQEVVSIPVALGPLSPSNSDPENGETKRGELGRDLTERLEGRDFFDLMLAASSSPSFSASAWAAGHRRHQRYLSLDFTGSGRLLLRPYRRYNLMRALDEPDRKMVWSGYGNTRELYDLKSDPFELDNLSWSESERVRRMEGELDRQIRAWVRSEPLAADSETTKQLRALGYID